MLRILAQHFLGTRGRNETDRPPREGKEGKSGYQLEHCGGLEGTVCTMWCEVWSVYCVTLHKESDSEREKHSLHLPSFKLGCLSLIQIVFSHSLQNCGLKCHKRSHQESHSLSPFFLFPGVTHTPEHVCPGPHTRMCPHPKHAPLGCTDSYFRTVLKMTGSPFSISICCNDSQRQINRENQS